MRKHLANLLKIGITLIGLVYVLNQVPLADISAELVHLRWGWIVWGFVLTAAGLVIRAYRWLLLLRGLGVAIQFTRLVMLYFVGSFFNAFLLSGFGGDVVRVLEVSQDVPTPTAAGTVIVDRLSGLLMLFLMALLALPFRPSGFPDDLLWVVTAVSLIGLIGGFVLLEGRLIRRFAGWLPGPLSLTDEKRPLARLLNAVQGCGWQAIGGALAVSILFNLVLVGSWSVSGLALGYDVSYSYYLLVVPILSVALLVPSVSGLGVRESLAPLLFAGAALTNSQAVTLSLLVFIIMRLSGLIGAPLYLWSVLRGNSKNEAIEINQPSTPDTSARID